ncbi:hypothetical protein Nepgr_008289 [Nepenthes gracilis]|uniref:Uncharacterized protein n=1 Tax=Nepenthes gracilis TaxID=150966 RepID=A0AAD3XJ49_NEPGR|nr:hypothetical protein Nepgr_008289 [Nepenthes gracilis]
MTSDAAKVGTTLDWCSTSSPLTTTTLSQQALRKSPKTSSTFHPSASRTLELSGFPSLSKPDTTSTLEFSSHSCLANFSLAIPLTIARRSTPYTKRSRFISHKALRRSLTAARKLFGIFPLAAARLKALQIPHSQLPVEALRQQAFRTRNTPNLSLKSSPEISPEAAQKPLRH